MTIAFGYIGSEISWDWDHTGRPQRFGRLRWANELDPSAIRLSWRRRVAPVLAWASCAAGDPVEDGAESEQELIVGEVGRRGCRVLGHGGGQAGEAFGVGQSQ